MPFWMSWLNGESPVAVTIISIALMLACGFLMTRITKKLRLPNVTAYIVGGILAGISIAIGGTVFLSLENKVLGALFFTVGLFAVCVLRNPIPGTE